MSAVGILVIFLGYPRAGAKAALLSSGRLALVVYLPAWRPASGFVPILAAVGFLLLRSRLQWR